MPVTGHTLAKRRGVTCYKINVTTNSALLIITYIRTRVAIEIDTFKTDMTQGNDEEACHRVQIADER